MALGICTLVRRFVQPKPYFLQRRHQSSGRGHMVEVDLSETEVVGVKTLDEMVHKLMVLKSTPDWLPFLPGSSFWVPPRRSNSDVANLMANHQSRPSYLSQGPALRYPSNVGVEVVEEGGDDIEKMLDEVQILEARAQGWAVAEAEAEALAEAEAHADADAQVEAQADAEAVAEAAAESKSRAATNSRKTPLYENDEG